MDHIGNDLESFLRWGMVVVDELEDAFWAMAALEDGFDARDEPCAGALEEGFDAKDEPCAGVARNEAIGSDGSSTALVNDLDTSVVFGPKDLLMIDIDRWYHPLIDYLLEPKLKRLMSTSPEHRSLVYQKVLPALDKFDEFWDALDKAGLSSIHDSVWKDRPTPDANGNGSH